MFHCSQTVSEFFTSFSNGCSSTFQAFQVIKLFLGKLERISDNPEVAAEQQKAEGNANSRHPYVL